MEVAIEKCAKKSCLDATELDQNLCSLNGSAIDMELVDLKASYNLGWQRKSSGRAYESEKKVRRS